MPIFDFANEWKPTNSIDIPDIGNFFLETIDEENMFYYYLMVKTCLGTSSILSYGPIVPDVELLPDKYSICFERIQFNDKKVMSWITKWLNDKNKKITAAYIVDEIGTGSTKAEIKEVVEDAVEWYESYLTLASVKYYLTVDGGIIDSMVASFGEEYPVNNQTEIENLGELAKTEVKVAADLDAIVDILIEYYLEMEAVPTSDEIADAEAVEAYNKDLDEKIADLIDAAKEADSKFAISADEQILLDKMVQIYKDKNAEEGPASTVDPADVDDFAYLIQNLKWTGTVPAWLATAVEPSFDDEIHVHPSPYFHMQPLCF